MFAVLEISSGTCFARLHCRAWIETSDDQIAPALGESFRPASLPGVDRNAGIMVMYRIKSQVSPGFIAGHR